MYQVPLAKFLDKSMNSQPHPFKRSRKEEKRDPDLYFDDGNIILCTSEKDGTLVHFRVHKSVLAKNSPIFRDMFSIPSPSDETIEMYDGIPLVFLYDDPEDLKDFLQTLYSPSYLPFLPLRDDTVAKVKAPLKLATKYAVDDLRSRIIAQLEQDWPSSLKDLEKMEKVKRPRPEPVICLARDHDVSTVLLAAFYQLCTSRAEDMDLRSLRVEDVHTVLVGRERIQNHIFHRFPFDPPQWADLYPFFPPDCDYCDSDSYWSDCIPRLWEARDPMMVLRSLRDTIYSDRYITCSNCRNLGRENLAREYNQFFENLPSFLDLD